MAARRSKSRFGTATPEAHTARVRAVCLRLPGTSERLSHAEPTFFVGKRVFAMMSLNHHDDGRYAVVLPSEKFFQDAMIAERPRTFFFPAYVGVRGWVGVELTRIGDRELAELILSAWARVAPRKLVDEFLGASADGPESAKPRSHHGASLKSAPAPGPRGRPKAKTQT